MPATANSACSWRRPSHACSCATAARTRPKVHRNISGAEALHSCPFARQALQLLCTDAAMKDSLRQQFERLSYRLSELDTTLADGSVAADMKRYRALSKEQSEVSELVAHVLCVD
eukprot:Opistho-1_new@50292